MAQRFKAGDKVAWNTRQGETQGKVLKTLTKPTAIKGHRVAASNENPEVLVASARLGAPAAHRPAALKRL